MGFRALHERWVSPTLRLAFGHGIVIDNDPHVVLFKDGIMKFRLTYAGPLFSSGNDSRNGKADHKHDIRIVFHPQLKRIWDTVPFLKHGRSSWPVVGWDSGIEEPTYDRNSRAKEFQIRPWNFVPLVTQSMQFYCGIEILFMRVGGGSSILSQGDLDGRLKTLLDALSVPDDNQGYSTRKFPPSVNPLFVLLENDRQITKVAVETDYLLESVDPTRPEHYDVNDARLLVNVNISPIEPANWSLPFL